MLCHFLSFFFPCVIPRLIFFDISKVQMVFLQCPGLLCFNSKSVAIRGLFQEGWNVKDIILLLQQCIVGYCRNQTPTFPYSRIPELIHHKEKCQGTRSSGLCCHFSFHCLYPLLLQIPKALFWLHPARFYSVEYCVYHEHSYIAYMACLSTAKLIWLSWWANIITTLAF